MLSRTYCEWHRTIWRTSHKLPREQNQKGWIFEDKKVWILTIQDPSMIWSMFGLGCQVASKFWVRHYQYSIFWMLWVVLFQSGNSVNGVRIAAKSGTSVALGGPDGTVLVVGYPGVLVVCLFDKDGSQWVQCGEALKKTRIHNLAMLSACSGTGWGCYKKWLFITNTNSCCGGMGLIGRPLSKSIIVKQAAVNK